eukprot:9996393-Heterocapsa_arctica.AAC.1
MPALAALLAARRLERRSTPTRELADYGNAGGGTPEEDDAWSGDDDAEPGHTDDELTFDTMQWYNAGPARERHWIADFVGTEDLATAGAAADL